MYISTACRQSHYQPAGVCVINVAIQLPRMAVDRVNASANTTD